MRKIFIILIYILYVQTALAIRPSQPSFELFCDKSYKDCHVYLTESLLEASYYNKLFYFIQNASSDVTITLHLNGNGGHFNTVLSFVHVIESTQATIITSIDGTVQSGHAMIALSSKNIRVSKFAYIMVHRAGFVHVVNMFFTKKNEVLLPEQYCLKLKDKNRGISSQHKCFSREKVRLSIEKNFFKKYIKKWLTKEEQERYWQGDDIYLLATDINNKRGK